MFAFDVTLLLLEKSMNLFVGQTGFFNLRFWGTAGILPLPPFCAMGDILPVGVDRGRYFLDIPI